MDMRCQQCNSRFGEPQAKALVHEVRERSFVIKNVPVRFCTNTKCQNFFTILPVPEWLTQRLIELNQDEVEWENL